MNGSGVRRVAAMVLVVAAAFLLTGCVADQFFADPIATPLAAVQSGTLRIQLHQVLVLTVNDDQRYTARIADPTVVSVVEHHDAAAGRFEPELVALKAGSTEVALTSSQPGHEVVGFRVIVTAPPVVRALATHHTDRMLSNSDGGIQDVTFTLTVATG